MNKWFFRDKTFTKKALSTLIGLGITLLTFIVLSNFVFAQGPIEVLEEIQITFGDDREYYQDVSGNVVVFDKNGDIFGYNLTSAVGFPIATQSAFQTYPNISGDTIAWMDQRAGNWDIHGYDLGSGGEFPITTNAAAQKFPAIDGNIVIWADWRNGSDGAYGNDIYGYDLINKTEFRVTNQSAPVACPAVSGNVVVWSDCRFGGWDIFSKNLISGAETQLTFTWTSSPYCPAISNDIIVIGKDQLVTGIDLSGNVLFETWSYPYVASRPAIDGNLVVWVEKPFICVPGPCGSIIGYDIESGYRFLISDDGYEPHFPAISDDVVVWRELTSLFPTNLGGVYASRLLETVRLSNNSQFVDPGEVLTYTIALAEASSIAVHKRITNTLSPFTTLDLSSLSVTSESYGYDPEIHAITWEGDVSSANPVTITYRTWVSPAASLGDHIVNTAVISDQTSVFSRKVDTWIPYRKYLPVIMKD